MANILLIENDLILASLIVSALRQDGHCLSEADTLTSALEAAKNTRQRFDLVLAEASTGALANRHLTLMKATTVVFMSGSASFVCAARTGRSDDQTLRKPFTAEQLRRCVRKALAHTEKRPGQLCSGPRDWWLDHPVSGIDTWRRSFDSRS